jgi:hypothetical protein
MVHTAIPAELIEDAIHYDPIAHAEDLLGASCKDDMAVAGLGLSLQMRSSKIRQRLMEADGDTCFSETAANYRAKLDSFGFELVFELPFEGVSCGQTYQDQRLYVYYREPGQLLKFDTYGSNVNSAKVWYNWRPTDPEYPRSILSSGGWHATEEADRQLRAEFDSKKYEQLQMRLYQQGQLSFCGDHNAREALRHKLTQLERYGEFVAPWEAVPSMWLLHWADTKDHRGGDRPWQSYNSAAISHARAAQFPEHVKKAVSFEKWRTE